MHTAEVCPRKQWCQDWHSGLIMECIVVWLYAMFLFGMVISFIVLSPSLSLWAASTLWTAALRLPSLLMEESVPYKSSCAWGTLNSELPRYPLSTPHGNSCSHLVSSISNYKLDFSSMPKTLLPDFWHGFSRRELTAGFLRAAIVPWRHSVQPNIWHIIDTQ